MSKRIALVFVAWLCTIAAQATHIVGGEIELSHVEGDQYELRLIQYFDNFYGSPGAEDETLLVSIFSKANRSLVDQYQLFKESVTFVPYTNTECAVGQLSTKRIVYANLNVFLTSARYGDPEGYYVIWERCCRNQVLDNIFAPGETGQTFLLQFPSVIKDGEPFINNTPQLFPPLADYACVDRPFYFDFAGDDIDGDSLVYSLAAPLNSSVFTPVPTPTPPPHPTVGFLGGLSGNNPIPADLGKGLMITNDGFLTVTPNTAGLYVFSVQVDEFRDGEKIGEVRRDFQMLVLGDCAPAIPPLIQANLPNGNPYIPGDTVRLAYDDERCFSVFITDEEAFSSVSLQVKPVNFDTDENLTALASPTSGSLVIPGDSLEVEICLPQCPYTEDGYFILDIVAFDDACAKPLTDTVRMYLYVEPVPNDPPSLTTTSTSDTLIGVWGNTIAFDVRGTDPERDPISVYMLPNEFDPEAVFMEYTPGSGDGDVNTSFSWSLDCDLQRLGNKDVYEMDFVVEDIDECERIKTDTITQVIQVQPLSNTPPVLTADFINSPVTREDDVYVIEFGEGFTLRANGTDANNDDITLRLVSGDSSGMLPTQITWSGDVRAKGAVDGDVTWFADCNFIEFGQDEFGPFALEFVLEDEFCIFPETDTLVVNVLARDKPQPIIDFQLTNIFTPNGDDINETFTIPELPEDNCFGKFQKITVFNRWGKKVFESEQRDFEWNGAGEPVGVYYWIIDYTLEQSYKGWVALHR